MRDPKSGAWYDEVWETTVATVALLRAEGERKGPKQQVRPWLISVLEWFTTVPERPSGEFINAHYSGFIAWLLGEIRAGGAPKDLLSSPAFLKFSEKVERSVTWLESELEVIAPNLWSQYTFANAYIVYGLSRLHPFRIANGEYALPSILWFKQQQGKHGGFEDIEDTALAVLALSSMKDRAEEDASFSSLLEHIARLIPPKPEASINCFVGYSGKSQGTAATLKEYLTKTVSQLSVRDWKWDFQIGNILFAELEAASRECNLAIFLVTKDDDLQGHSGIVISSPRDNIVFEVGFFLGRLGRENIILIVEEGTKIPSDWGGILYVSMRDRTQLGDVALQVSQVMRTILQR